MIWIVVGYIIYFIFMQTIGQDETTDAQVLFILVAPIVISTCCALLCTAIFLWTGDVEFVPVEATILMPVETTEDGQVTYAIKQSEPGKFARYEYIKLDGGAGVADTSFCNATTIVTDDGLIPRYERKIPKTKWYHWLVGIPFYDDAIVLYIPEGSVRE